jgi:hypothetical protein
MGCLRTQVNKCVAFCTRYHLPAWHLNRRLSIRLHGSRGVCPRPMAVISGPAPTAMTDSGRAVIRKRSRPPALTSREVCVRRREFFSPAPSETQSIRRVRRATGSATVPSLTHAHLRLLPSTPDPQILCGLLVLPQRRAPCSRHARAGSRRTLVASWLRTSLFSFGLYA